MALRLLMTAIGLPLTALALPKKTAFVGEKTAKGRIAIVDACRRSIDMLVSQGSMSSGESTGFKQKLAFLRRRADSGWSSSEELSALGAVFGAISKSHASAALDEVKGDLKKLWSEISKEIESASKH